MRVLDPKVPKAGRPPSRAAVEAAARRAASAAPSSPARAGYATTIRLGQNARAAAVLDGQAALRPKLRIGTSNHASEGEATRAANAVTAPLAATRAVHPTLAGPAVGQSGPAAPSLVQRVLARAGQPLEWATRTLMESRFGASFGGVRVHRDGLAAESARAVKARAYTVGQSIAFNHAEYAPHSPAGRWLLAHELAHTLQQRGGGEPILQRFESYEHVDLGDKAKGAEGQLILLSCHELDFGNRKGPKAKWSEYWQKRWAGYDKTQVRAAQDGLTYGEVVALVGDFYPSFAALDKASLGEVVALIPLIRNRTPATTADFQKATGGRYADLATRNVVHFSGTPTKSEKTAWKKEYGVEISSNMDVWREQHRLAIGHARAGRANLAWGVNAGADHFLSDAFSAGHIRVPRAAMMGTMKSIESKVLHDLDNLFGLEVVNGAGHKWITYGDNHLNDDPRNTEGLAMVMKAVEASKKDIADALAGGKAYPEPNTIKGFEVEALVPRAVPAKDRWTGRPPNGGPPSVKELYFPTTHYSHMWLKLARDESGYLAKNKTILDDVEVRDWVAGTESEAIGRAPFSEKIRMLDTLTGGIIDGKDLIAIVKILDSVPTALEMGGMKGWYAKTFIADSIWRSRIEKALSRTKFGPAK